MLKGNTSWYNQQYRRSPLQATSSTQLTKINHAINSIDTSDYYKMHAQRKLDSQRELYKLDANERMKKAYQLRENEKPKSSKVIFEDLDDNTLRLMK